MNNLSFPVIPVSGILIKFASVTTNTMNAKTAKASNSRFTKNLVKATVPRYLVLHHIDSLCSAFALAAWHLFLNYASRYKNTLNN